MIKYNRALSYAIVYHPTISYTILLISYILLYFPIAVPKGYCTTQGPLCEREALPSGEMKRQSSANTNKQLGQTNVSCLDVPC